MSKRKIILFLIITIAAAIVFFSNFGFENWSDDSAYNWAFCQHYWFNDGLGYCESFWITLKS